MVIWPWVNRKGCIQRSSANQQSNDHTAQHNQFDKGHWRKYECQTHCITSRDPIRAAQNRPWSGGKHPQLGTIQQSPSGEQLVKANDQSPLQERRYWVTQGLPQVSWLWSCQAFRKMLQEFGQAIEERTRWRFHQLWAHSVPCSGWNCIATRLQSLPERLSGRIKTSLIREKNCQTRTCWWSSESNQCPFAQFGACWTTQIWSDNAPDSSPVALNVDKNAQNRVQQLHYAGGCLSSIEVIEKKWQLEILRAKRGCETSSSCW